MPSITTHRRGMAIVYVMATLTLLMAFASLGVDLARVQVAKTELRRTADAAARAAASAMSGGVSSAEAAAVAITTANHVDGESASLVTASDVEFGTWSTAARTFTVLTGANRSNANAVRVTVRRTAARGNAIPLVFAPAIGKSSCDVYASTIAHTQGNALGFVGLNGISLKNNLDTAVYDSSVDSDPSSGSYETGVTLASNGDITGKNNNEIGGAILGPSGSNNIPAGFNTTLSSPLSFAQPSFSTTGSAVTVNGTTTLAAGTHYISTLTVKNNGSLRFSGPATVYISGNVVFENNGEIRAYNDIPGNLVINQKGTGDFGTSSANNIDVVADIYAPGVDFNSKNNAKIRGRGIFGSITAKNNLDLFYDSDLSPIYAAGGGGGVVIVK